MIWLMSILLLAASPAWQEEVKKIDRQIYELQELQEKLRASAQRSVNNAMRWQFQNENYMDARRAWDKAAADKQKIQEIQDQIDDLNVRKQKLLGQYGKSAAP